ncbi:hypothetical protein HK096_002611 [Nowakowskiella sp. JEL0078]|nr:hypothetical protein HK096_002611 [Nowakowskiella sp. JEL0078]
MGSDAQNNQKLLQKLLEQGAFSSSSVSTIVLPPTSKITKNSTKNKNIQGSGSTSLAQQPMDLDMSNNQYLRRQSKKHQHSKSNDQYSLKQNFRDNQSQPVKVASSRLPFDENPQRLEFSNYSSENMSRSQLERSYTSGSSAPQIIRTPSEKTFYSQGSPLLKNEMILDGSLHQRTNSMRSFSQGYPFPQTTSIQLPTSKTPDDKSGSDYFISPKISNLEINSSPKPSRKQSETSTISSDFHIRLDNSPAYSPQLSRNHSEKSISSNASISGVRSTQLSRKQSEKSIQNSPRLNESPMTPSSPQLSRKQSEKSIQNSPRLNELMTPGSPQISRKQAEKGILDPPILWESPQNSPKLKVQEIITPGPSSQSQYLVEKLPALKRSQSDKDILAPIDLTSEKSQNTRPQLRKSQSERRLVPLAAPQINNLQVTRTPSEKSTISQTATKDLPTETGVVFSGYIFKQNRHGYFQKRLFRFDGFVLLCLSSKRQKLPDFINMLQFDPARFRGTPIAEEFVKALGHFYPGDPPTPALSNPLIAAHSELEVNDDKSDIYTKYYHLPKWILPTTEMQSIRSIVEHPVADPSSPDACTFIIQCKQRDYVLRAPTEVEYKRWSFLLSRMSQTDSIGTISRSAIRTVSATDVESENVYDNQSRDVQALKSSAKRASMWQESVGELMKKDPAARMSVAAISARHRIDDDRESGESEIRTSDSTEVPRGRNRGNESRGRSGSGGERSHSGGKNVGLPYNKSGSGFGQGRE